MPITLYGGPGDDTLSGGAGDVLDGGADDDTADMISHSIEPLSRDHLVR